MPLVLKNIAAVSSPKKLVEVCRGDLDRLNAYLLSKTAGKDLSAKVRGKVKNFGPNKTRLASEANCFVDFAVSTGSTNLDLIIHREPPYGIPAGSIVELFSDDESQGKSLLLESIIAQAQLLYWTTKLQDPEGTFDRPRGQVMGINLGQLLYDDLDIIEFVFSDFRHYARLIQGKMPENMKLRIAPGLLYALDTLSATETLRESEGEEKDGFNTQMAIMMSRKMRGTMRYVRRQPIIFIVVNQGRTDVTRYGSPTTTAGGKALKYYARLRMKCKFIGAVHDENNVEIGNRMRVTIVKNKVSPPFGVAEFDVHYKTGIQDKPSWFWFLKQVKAAKHRSKGIYDIKLPDGTLFSCSKGTFVSKMEKRGLTDQIRKLMQDCAASGRVPMLRRMVAKDDEGGGE